MNENNAKQTVPNSSDFARMTAPRFGIRSANTAPHGANRINGSRNRTSNDGNGFPLEKSRVLCVFSENDIETLYNICTPAPNGLSLPNNAFVAKMRYLQFYIAHQLYLTFNDVTSFACDTQPSMVSINLLFGINDGIKLFDELNCSHYLYDSVVQVRIADYIDESIIDEYWNSDIGKNILFDISKLKKKNSFNQEYWDNRVVFMPFLWWYDTKEIPVRNDLFNKSSHYIKNYREIESKLKRLNSGFSLQTLKKICGTKT